MLAIGFLVGLGAALLFVLPRCWHRVDEGYVAVLTSFGRALRERDKKKLRVFRPGLLFKLPWHMAHVIPIMEQIVELAGDDGARTVMAKDGTVLRIDSSLRYAPLEQDLYAYEFDMSAPKEHITALFSCLLRSQIASFSGEDTPSGPSGSYAVMRRERPRLTREMIDFSSKEIGATYGVELVAVDLADILPPEELDEALNAAMHAHTEADRAYARAEADAQRRVIAAQHGVEIAATKAQAAEREMLTLAGRLAELDREGTLSLYVARRQAEVLSQSRTHFVRRGR